MVGQRRGTSRLVVGMAGVLGAMFLATMPVCAGLLTTDVTLADFSFVGAQVDYDPDPKTYARSAIRDLEFSTADPDLWIRRLWQWSGQPARVLTHRRKNR